MAQRQRFVDVPCFSEAGHLPQAEATGLEQGQGQDFGPVGVHLQCKPNKQKWDENRA